MNSKNLSYLSILYIITWCLAPPLAYGTIYRVLAIAAVCILIFSSLHSASINLRQRVGGTILLSLYMVLVAFITGEPYVGKIGTIIILLSGVGFTLWDNQEEADIRQLNLLLLFIIAQFCLWNTTTLKALAFDDRIMRALVRNSDISASASLAGIGGYGYIYCVVPMLPIGIAMLKEKRHLFIKAILVYFLVTSVALAYMSQYFMALLLTILVFPLTQLANKRAGRGNMVILVIIGIFALLVYSNLENILSFLIDSIDIPTTKRKLTEMQQTLLMGERVEDTDFGERYERYTRDLDLILSSPILGVLRFSAVGKHSNILDMFAQYGIPIGIVYLRMLFRPCIDWIRNGMNIAYVVMIIVFVIAFMNSLPLTIAVPLCFGLPTYCKILWLKSQ